MSAPYDNVYDAAEQCDAAEIRRLVAGGADPDEMVDGTTALGQAARAADIEMARVLLEVGAQPDLPDEYGFTPMTYTMFEYHDNYGVSYGKEVDDYDQMALALIDGGAGINTPDEEGRTFLHGAALYDRTDLGRQLLDRGADVNARDCEMSTPLHCAVRGNSVSMVRLLLERGADHRAVVEGAGEGEQLTPLDEARRLDASSYEMTEELKAEMVAVLEAWATAHP